MTDKEKDENIKDLFKSILFAPVGYLYFVLETGSFVISFRNFLKTYFLCLILLFGISHFVRRKKKKKQQKAEEKDNDIIQ